MNRMRIVAVALLISSSTALGGAAGAQEAWPAVSGDPSTGAVRLANLPGAFDVVRGYAVGTGAPVVAFVAAPPAGAILLDMLTNRLEGDGSAEAVPGTSYFFLFDDDAPAVEASPGDPLIRRPGLRAALADSGVDAVVVLDSAGRPDSLSLRAASLGRQSPRGIVEAARRAALAGGVELGERPVSDFYAAGGMAIGSRALGSWLDAGLPAIALETAGEGAVAFANALPAEVLAGERVHSGSVRGDDVAYLRYPAPGGSLVVPDHIIISAMFMGLGIVGVALALGLLKGRRRTASIDAVFKEAAAAFGLSFAALIGSRGLAGLALTIAMTVGLAAIGGDTPWGVALALLIRIAGVLCAYYSVSGIAAKLGLHGDHRRIDAARAALTLLCFDVVAAAVLFPPAVPFLLIAFLVSATASGTAVAAAAGLVAVGVVALPFVDPRVVAAIGDASGGSGSVAAAMLDAGLAGNAAIAAFVAPFGLWLGVASSPDSHLRRGRRTAFFWLAGALACAAAEALARLA